MPNTTNSPDEIKFKMAQLETGVRLHYAERGKMDGEVIIFLHGYTDSWYSFSTVLSLLSTEYHAYSLTQRGHGDSEKPDRYNISDFAADIKAFMDELGIEKASIVGHSMGSFVAQKVAIDYADRVKRLVLIGSAPSAINNQSLLEFQEFVGTLEGPIDRKLVYEFQSSTLLNPVLDEFLEKVVSESMKVPARVWQEALAGLSKVDHKDQLHKINAPTLIIWGDHDDFFTQEEQETLKNRISNSTFKLYPDVGHGLHWEKPQEIVNDIEKFMQSE
ncbi:MAG: alpha/beta hydrolase [Candidatus Lokiarchaeota archaeon]|nr:alpha/beta hydrolase [Candidatus Lokiarchaeota archaeon]